MIKKNFIKNYLRSYHRPSAKLESLIISIKQIFYSQKSKVFSERSFLLKKSINHLIFYNHLGRFLLYLKLFVSIIIFNKFGFNSEIKLNSYKENKFKENNFRNLNPNLPFHLKDNNSNNRDKIDFEEFLYNYKLHYKLYSKSGEDSEWWIKCRKEFKELFINSDGSINQSALQTFRGSNYSSAAILNDSSRLLNYKISERIRKINSLRLIMLFHQLAERIDIKTLILNSESYVGSPPILRYRNVNLTQRILRYSYYLSSLINNLPFLLDEQKKLIVDIGGGYGGLIRSMAHYYKNHTYIICELPETILLSEYYLRNCFIDKSFLHINKLGMIDDLKKEELLKYDFIFITPEIFFKIKNRIIDLTINTTSLGEMTAEVQQKYINSIEINSNYFYSVNRYEDRKDKYNTIGFSGLNFVNNWLPIHINYTHTYHYEYLGKNLG